MGTDPDRLDTDAVLSELRRDRPNPHLLGGFGPLVLALIVALVIILAVPSIAPERIVQVPVQATTTTSEAGG